MSDEVQTVPAEVVPAAAGGGSSNWTIPKNLTAMKLLNETKSFVIVRALVCAVVSGIMFVTSIVAIAICFGILALVAKGGNSSVGGIIALVFLGSLIGGFKAFLRFVKTTVLYAIKAAHVAAITEYLKTGKTPVTEKGYKGVLAFGKEKVAKNLGTTAVFFVFDRLVAKATRQIMRWVNKAQNLLSFIPGSEQIFKFVNFILETALNFVDEAILSYVFYHSEEPNVFKKACHGLVYYAQAWKGMLMGATKVAVFVWVLKAVVFLLFYVLVFGALTVFGAGGGAIPLILGIIVAYTLMYGVQTALIEPYATCMMIKDYHIAIAGQELKLDLHEKIMGVSKAFKDLFNKSKEPDAIPAGAGAAAEAEAVPVGAAAQ